MKEHFYLCLPKEFNPHTSWISRTALTNAATVSNIPRKQAYMFIVNDVKEHMGLEPISPKEELHWKNLSDFSKNISSTYPSIHVSVIVTNQKQLSIILNGMDEM